MSVPKWTISKCSCEKYKKAMCHLPPLLSRIRFKVHIKSPKPYVIIIHQDSDIHCLIGAAAKQFVLVQPFGATAVRVAEP